MNKINALFSIAIFGILVGLSTVHAQMYFNNSYQFGNEWIREGQSYFKFEISQNGLYRINKAELQSAGFQVDQIPAANIQIIKFGQEIDIYRSTSGIMSNSDFIEFYGTKHSGELDAVLFKNPQQQLLNTQYSFISDKASYYITATNTASTHTISIDPNDPTNVTTKDQYYFHKLSRVYTDRFGDIHYGPSRALEFGDYDDGYGYGSTEFGLINSQGVKSTLTHRFNPTNIFSGIGATLRIRTFGSGLQFQTLHELQIKLNSKDLQLDTFEGFRIKDIQTNINPQDLQAQMDIELVPQGAFGEDWQRISEMDLIYPRQFIFNQEKILNISILANASAKYIEMENFDGGFSTNALDITNRKKYSAFRDANGNYRFNFIPSQSDRNIIIYNSDQIKSVGSITKVNFKKFSNADYNYVFITHSKFENTTALQDYATYRASPEGRSFIPVIVNVEDLYDQFSFGLKRHPIALRNFMNYVRTQKWPNVQYATIVGKGLMVHKNRDERFNGTLDFIPTWGTPGADQLLFADTSNNSSVAIGRIAVIDEKEIAQYLNKVKAYERNQTLPNTPADREWVKNVVHLAGGDQIIYEIIEEQLHTAEEEIESNLFGANVTTFRKGNASPVQTNDVKELIKKINEGTSIVTFMGHSNNQRLDFAVPSVNDLNNADKYNMFIALGCYAGQMFDTARSISEVYTLADKKGSIAYLSNSTAGLVGILGPYTSEFYHNIGGKHYNGTIGQSLKETNNTLLAIREESMTIQVQTATLHGDPAIKFNVLRTPDFIPDANTFNTQPQQITVDLGSFDINLDILNIGQYVDDSINVLIEQEIPTGEKIRLLKKRIKAPKNRDNFTFNVPTLGDKSFGLNTIHIFVDSDNTIAELPNPNAENNNTLTRISGEKGVQMHFHLSGVRPIYPTEFAIINENKSALRASIPNTLLKANSYIIQIDTTEYFNSPLLETKRLNQRGGLLSWNPQQSFLPEVVYYWRVSIDSVGTGKFVWANSSFVSIPNKTPGWNQSHFFQFQKDKLVNVNNLEPNRYFQFNKAVKSIKAANASMPNGTVSRPRVHINNTVEMDFPYRAFSSFKSGVAIGVLDPLTGELWQNVTGRDYQADGLVSGTREDKTCFYYKTDTPADRDRLYNFLNNVIPNDHVILFFTITVDQVSFKPEQWENKLYDFFTAQGLKEIQKLKTLGSFPFIGIFKKGDPSFEVKEYIAANDGVEYSIFHEANYPFESGAVNSTIIGPASSWLSFEWDYTSDPSHNHYARILGIDNLGQETELFIVKDKLTEDLTTVSATQYPRLRIEWLAKDSVDRVAPNLKHWRVYFGGIPEAAWNPTGFYQFNKDTIDQGKDITFDMQVDNISPYNMDSLLVKFKIIDRKNKETISYKRYAPLPGNQNYRIFNRINTSKLNNIHRLVVEINPENDQPEKYNFNNTVIQTFYVRPDFRKPYLDVEIDGQRVRQGGLVSNKPEIKIKLNDENLTLPLEDTSLFNIQLTYPDKTTREVFFVNKDVEFIPGDPNVGRNTAIVVLRPDTLVDGTYVLHVIAQDVSGNSAVDQEYILEFKVLKGRWITGVSNYPNPFKDKTKFVCSIGGYELPFEYHIQIIDAYGNPVRHISKADIGKIIPGTFPVTYDYDGCDDRGAPLPSGMYIYRFVPTGEVPQGFENYSKEDIDNYFNSATGRLVIMR